MKRTVRMLKAFESQKVGDLVDMDETKAKEWAAAGIAELIEGDPIQAAVQASVGDYLQAQVGEAIVKQLRAAKESITKGMEKFPRTAKEEPNEDRKGGFKSMGHFIRDLAQAGRSMETASPILKSWLTKADGPLGMNEGVPGEGGVLVPVAFYDQLMQTVLEASIVRQRATLVPMATNSIDVPVLVDASHNGGVFGGIVVRRPIEAAEKVGSKPYLDKVTLKLYKLVGMCYATDELLQDSPISIEALITSKFGEAIAFYEDNDYINGTGAPGVDAEGILNSPALVVVDKVVGQADATIIAENIFEMWSRLYAPSQRNAIWLANNDTFPQLASLRFEGAAGGIYPLWVPPNGMAGAPFGTILGRPLILTEKCQTLGGEGDIILADLSQYLIGNKVGAGAGIQAASSIHLRFDYDETAFRFVLRTDGKGWWTSPLTPLNSAKTLSPFVTLGDRVTNGPG